MGSRETIIVPFNPARWCQELKALVGYIKQFLTGPVFAASEPVVACLQAICWKYVRDL